SALRVPVPTSRGDGCALPPASRKCLPKLAAELLVAIMQQVTTAVQIYGVLHRCVARHLLHPARVRMAGDAAQGYATAAHFNEEQHVVGHQSSPGQHFHGEEVRTDEYVYVRLDELLPRRRPTPLRCRCDVVPAQNIAHRLV